IQDLQDQTLPISKQVALAFVLHLPVVIENSLEQGTDELMEFVLMVHQIIKYASQWNWVILFIENGVLLRAPKKI
ncbi:4948_t:CDS:1, partial [Ambispora leptoticha]